MKEENVVMSKAEDFAIRICNLYSYLSDNKKETIISKQIMRSGTSIGANIAEAVFAESSSDFVHKLRIARKEANETKYWLRLLFRSDKLTESEFTSLHNDCDGLLRMLSRIILTCDTKQDSH